MKTTETIFSNPLEFELDDNFYMAGECVNQMVNLAIEYIDENKELGPGYAEGNPALLAGYVQAMVIDHNARNLVNTMQEGIAAIVDELRKAGEKSA